MAAVTIHYEDERDLPEKAVEGSLVSFFATIILKYSLKKNDSYS
jgi:hypothetical protein